MRAKKTNLFLEHLENGQRYPLSGTEVSIGRSSGDLVFPQDTNLNQQHCLLTQKDGVWSICDLNSRSGTWLESQKLIPMKPYPIHPGQTLQLGEQKLRLIEISLNQKRRKKKRKSPPSQPESDAYFWFAVLAFAVGLGVFLWRGPSSRRQPAAAERLTLSSPFALVDREAQDVLEEYNQMGERFKRGELSESEVAKQIRLQLLPRLSSVHAKLSVVRPDREYDRRRTDLNAKLLKSVHRQLEAYANLVETKNQKFADQVEIFATESENLSRDLAKLKRESAERH